MNDYCLVTLQILPYSEMEDIGALWKNMLKRTTERCALHLLLLGLATKAHTMVGNLEELAGKLD